MTIVDEIGQESFNWYKQQAIIPDDRISFIHDEFLYILKGLLKKQSYDVVIEQPLTFYYKYRRPERSREALRKGYMDVFASNQYVTIAIEYDSGNHLKYKSIEKLVTCGANYCIGIVRNRQHKEKTLNENYQRICKVFQEVKVTKAIIWLVVMSENSVNKISFSNGVAEFNDRRIQLDDCF